MPTIKEILLGIEGDSTGADAAIDRVAAGLDELDQQKATATVDLARKEFDAQFAQVEARLAELNRQTAKPKVKLQVESMRADAERAAQDASAAFDRYFHAQGRDSSGRFSGIAHDAERLAADLGPVLNLLGQTSQAGEELGSTLGQAGTTMGDLAGKTRDLAEVGQVALVVLLAGLTPAILALAGSLVAAIGGAGALAIALAGTLVPAALGALAVFTRLGAILNVAKELSMANRNAAYQAAEGHQRAAAAAASRHAAEIAVRDALQGVTRAERAYAQAVEESRKRLDALKKTERTAEQTLGDTRRRAQRSESDAHRRVISEQKTLKQAVTDAYKHWADLIDDVKRDQLDLEGAQLGVLDAQDALNKAQNEYNALLNQIPSDKLGDVLKKLNDVNLPEDQVKAFITAAMGPDADPDFANKLYTSHLKLLHAQHDLKVATQDVADATKKLGRDQKELNGYTQKGIAAYGPYRAATKNLAAAKRDEARATADGNREISRAVTKLREARRAVADYEKVGVRGQNAVRNAADAVKQAQQRLADAHWQARNAAKGAGAAMGGMGSAASRLKSDLAALSPAERGLLYALVGRDGKGGLKGAFRSAFGTDSIMRAFTVFVGGIARMLRVLSPDLHALSRTVAGIFLGIAKGATGKGATNFFRLMIGFARALAPVGAGALRDLAGGLANIAKWATPGLVGIFLAFAHAMRSFRDATAGAGAGKTIGVMVDSFRAWAGLVTKVVVGFGKLATVVAPFGNDLVRWLGKGAESLGKWAQSSEGTKKIASFFHDTLPLAKSLAGLVWNIVVAFLQFVQFVAPILKPIVDSLSFMFKWLGKVLGLLSRIIPRPIRELAGIFLNITNFGPKILAWLGKLPGILGDVAKTIGGLGIANAIIDQLGTAATDAVAAAKAVGDAIWKGIKAVLDASLDVAGWITNSLGGLGDFGSKVLGLVGDGINAAAGTVASAGSTIVNWLAGGLSGISGWGAGILTAIGSAVSKAAAGGATAVKDVGDAVGNWIIAGAKGALNVGGKILNWIGDAIRRALRGASGLGGRLARWVVNGLGNTLVHVINVGRDVVGWIRSGVLKALRAVGGLGGRVASWIISGLRGALNIGGRIVSWLSRGVSGIKSLGRRMADWIWDGMKSLPGRILSGVKGAINAVIRGWNNLHFRIGGTDLGPLGHLPSIDIKTPNIPLLAAGGIVSRATRAVIGEQPGVSEAVLPLTDRVLGSIARSIMGAMPNVMAMSAPSVAGAAPAHFTAPRVTDSRAAAGPAKIEDHLHVHGHTQTVDPDPRTMEALQEARRRKKGNRR